MSEAQCSDTLPDRQAHRCGAPWHVSSLIHNAGKAFAGWSEKTPHRKQNTCLEF